MLPGLSALEVGRLRMSVGYGTHTKGRPLSPIEVGTLLRRTMESGASLQDCVKTLKVGSSQLSRFLGVLDLPADLLHYVDFGRSAPAKIGFTTAVELVRVPDPDDQRAIATAILERGLETDEVRQVAQIRRRSGRPIDECLKEIIGMRPTVERVYVFIGAIVEADVQAALAALTQAERNALLHSALKVIGLSASGRLGEQVFTLAGDEQLNSRLSSEGWNIIEARLITYIAGKVANVQRNG